VEHDPRSRQYRLAQGVVVPHDLTRSRSA
jgi:hypothetical protein